MQPGDVVRLKSGGAAMTIERQVDGNSVICVWWSQKEEKFESRTFFLVALEKAK
jgi:Uncharacterized small protein (DUF2158).